LHILIKNPVAHRLVYNSKWGGRPQDTLTVPEKSSKKRLSGQARFVLDPTVTDQPNDDVKIYRYQQLSEQEKKEIDDFCNRLIANAQKLKAKQLKAEQKGIFSWIFS
jgi:hypothetical protein